MAAKTWTWIFDQRWEVSGDLKSMKTLFNITTSEDDVERFASAEDFEKMLKPHFDGVELMFYREDERQIIKKEHVIGYHMQFYPTWLDFWKGNEERLLREFDSKENWVGYYGGEERDGIIRRLKEDLKMAHQYGAEYVVFHVSESTVEEAFTWNYHYTDEEVIDATAELLNEIFKEEDGQIALFLENLWQPGLNFTRPKITKRLLDKIEYPNKGIMLDTGHLLHTNTALKTQEEGIAYIHQMLDEHGDLCKYIRGIHLNQSLTGEYCETMKKNPPKIADTFEERYTQMFFHAYAVDKHEPFTGEGIKELIKRIDPEYLTFEFITADHAQHCRYLKQQLKVLGRI